MGEDLDTEGKNEMTRPTLYTVHGFAVLIILLLVFFAGAKTGYVTQLLLDRDALAQEIDQNAATMSALSDRLIQMESALSLEVLASFYGEDHRGKLTASGTPFNPDEFTAASPWLPFGSRWIVRRIDTGAEVCVTITDRGPAIRLGRGLDLSRAAARELGMLEVGLARVEIRPGK